MRKAVATILTFALLLVVSVPAYAAPLEQEDPFLPTETGNEEWSEWKLVGTFTENEFDMYLALQGMSEEQLAEAGYEESDILELKNTSIEELLYQRAQMPQSELQSLGYSAEQIPVLKEYDGGPIAQNSQLREASADLTGYLYVQSSGRTAMSVMFNWTWSSPPLFSGTGITDAVGCAFAGTNFQNLPCTLTADKTRIFGRIAYYRDIDGIEFDHYESLDIQYPNINQFVKAEFRMGSSDLDTGDVLWAKSGSFTVTVREEVSLNNLYSAVFSLGYGHTIVEITPSISVSVGAGGISGGIGLSFGFGTTAMFYKHLRLQYDGTTEIFNGM